MSLSELPIQPRPLNDEERATYEWQTWVSDFGEEGQERLKGATVLISRVGGLGSVVAYDVTQGVSMGAFVGMPDSNVLISSRVPVAGAIAVGYRLLTAPFCMGFAGIEAFCAFLAVATHRICQPRQESLFERNAAG